MLLPDRALLLAAGCWLLLAVAAAVVPAWLPLWQTAGVALAALAVADGLAARSRLGEVSVQRQLAHAMPVGTWQTVGLRLR